MKNCKGDCDLWVYEQPVEFRFFFRDLEYSEEFLRCHKCDRELKTLEIIRSNQRRKKQAIDTYMKVA